MMEVTIIKRNDSNGVIVVYLNGIVDGEASQLFEKRIIDRIALEEKYFVINLKNTEYITSAGLRSFMVIGKLLKIRRGRIALSCLNESVSEIFKMMNFENLFAVYKTESDALDKICEAPSGTLY